MMTLFCLKMNKQSARSVRNIVFTTPGEKFFDEDFGSKISESLFENIDPISANLIQQEIRQSIKNYEPRVNLRRVLSESRL